MKDPLTTDLQLAAHASVALFEAAPDMLDMLCRYAGECAECGGSGEEIHHGDDTAYPCTACEDIRRLIERADPYKKRLSSEWSPKPKHEEPEDDIAF